MGVRKKRPERGIYKRGERYYISYYFNGDHVRRGGFKTEGEARRELTAIRSKIDGRTFVPPREDPFDGLVDYYDAEQKKKAGYASEKHYIARVREYFKKKTVQDIGVEDVERFLAYLEDLPTRGGKRRGAADVNHHMRVLYSILKKAVHRDWIAKNPADPERVKRPSKGEGRTQHLKNEEAGRLLDACHPHLHSIVQCGIETGMRPSEVKGLRWSEIREVILKDGSTAPMIFLPAERTKTRQARKVPVSARLAAHLASLKEEQGSPKVLSFSDLVFRFPEVARGGKGFLYYISRTGVTGASSELRRELGDEVGRIRESVELPVAVGFGISTPEQAASVAGVADGVVVGSALVRALSEGGVEGGRAFLSSLRAAMDGD